MAEATDSMILQATGYRHEDIPHLLGAGELIAVTGEPGSGKSRLLRYLHDNYQASALQRAALRGENRQKLHGRGGRAVWMDWSMPSKPGMLVVDYVRTAERLIRPLTRSALLRPLYWLSAVGIGARAHETAGMLSYYEKRLLVAAHSMCVEADLLIADDLVSGLSMDEGSRLCRLLKSICINHEMTVVFSTHRFHLASGSADRIILLSGGVITAISPPDPVTRRMVRATQESPVRV
jgi:ABC-type branched-subunit amino acid transport system ATPase component